MGAKPILYKTLESNGFISQKKCLPWQRRRGTWQKKGSYSPIQKAPRDAVRHGTGEPAVSRSNVFPGGFG